MKIIFKSIQLFVLILYLFSAESYAQTNKQDSLKPITTIGIFDGKKVYVGNFEVVEVYKINDYCISLTDLSQSKADSLKGKKLIVTGKLKIVEGKTLPAKTSTNGTIYEPYKEPDKKFICNPSFNIYYETREPKK